MVLKLPQSVFSKNTMFENDVKMYGTQAAIRRSIIAEKFENDVKMYGTQAVS